MAWHPRTMALPGLAAVLTILCVPAVIAQNDGLQPAAPTAPGAPVPIEHFSGLWAYNEDESLNAATGRQERSPRSATLRTPAGRGGASAGAAARPQPGTPASEAGRSTIGPRVAPGLNGQLGPTVAMIQENRSLTRDLLEVPESLNIRLSPGQITFVDDLLRERVYPTTGERSRYQLGAARFNAALEWNGPQLVKRIDAADGFRMTETYFLSEDARRLFVIVRVSSNRKNAPVMGVNRVYDRVDQ
jgi:hypothetical protein